MNRYSVTGMSCAACSARVEKAVSDVDGVTQCSVNLLTNSMMVEGTADAHSVIKAVQKAGYDAFLQNKSDDNKKNEEALKDKDKSKVLARLVASVIFLLPLMYVSMGAMMWGWPLPEILINNHAAMGFIQLILTTIIMVINQKFFINGFGGIVRLSPNMDSLVALGAGASYIYSTVVLFGMLLNHDNSMHDLYFESAAMILTLITVGKMLEAHSKGKTTDAIKGLMELAPQQATILMDGIETEVPIEKVQKGDIFVVRAGEKIPVDGVITDGNAAINESALTGESIPVDKSVGDTVSAATINQSGYIRCEAVRVGEDTTLSQIIRMVNNASASKAPIAKVADKVSGIFVPIVIIIAVLTMAVWMLVGKSFGWALARGISVLVISCPCALGLATPVAIMVGNGVSARKGILFKTAEAIENTGYIQIVALDKTGTITKGEPEVTDVYPLNKITEKELLTHAYALENLSEHPLAGAIVRKSVKDNYELYEISDFVTHTGNGLSGKVNGNYIYAGNLDFVLEQSGQKDSEIVDIYNKFAGEGKTPVLVGRNKTILGIIALADVIKEDSVKAVKSLKKMGIHTVMLTGDNERTAKAIADIVGVDSVVAGVLPKGKEEEIQKLRKHGKVAMVGDGINDAPALTAADMGIAIGNGTDIAIDAADVVLMKNSLMDVAAAINISRKTLLNIKENLFWAFIYNVIGIPLAAGVWYPLFGWELNPMFGAAAMSLSSFCVVANALRLNFIKTDKIKMKREENKIMTKTMKIEGMMCGHCEARVKKCLEGIQGVTEAVVDHKSGTAVVTFEDNVTDDILTKTVEEQDYKVTGIN